MNKTSTITHIYYHHNVLYKSSFFKVIETHCHLMMKEDIVKKLFFSEKNKQWMRSLSVCVSIVEVL